VNTLKLAQHNPLPASNNRYTEENKRALQWPQRTIGKARWGLSEKFMARRIRR
tara:strand:- start:546 stop:704 length:159 start_codon:yes stop_codon:yes gene_type:complete